MPLANDPGSAPGGQYNGRFWIPDGYGYNGPAQTPQENQQRQQAAGQQFLSQYGGADDAGKLALLRNNNNGAAQAVMGGQLSRNEINNRMMYHIYDPQQGADMNTFGNGQPQSQANPLVGSPSLQQTGASMGQQPQGVMTPQNQSPMPMQKINQMQGGLNSMYSGQMNPRMQMMQRMQQIQRMRQMQAQRQGQSSNSNMMMPQQQPNPYNR